MASVPPSSPSAPAPGPTTSSTSTSSPPGPPPTSQPPPPPPPPPTSSTTTTTTSISTTSSPDATSTSSSIPTSTSTTPILTPSSTSTSLSTSTSAIVTSLPGVGVTTTTSVVTLTTSRPTAPPTGTSDASSTGSKGFFHNTGAVAGVFTVVGLIVLAIIIAFITNCIRRRRAKKFDDEIAAAARDAANAQVPNFGYEDDDDEYRHGGYGAAAGVGGAAAAAGIGSKYSDMSHGTYSQPPMSIPESYGMREIPHQGFGPNPGEYFDQPSGNAYGAGAAAAAAGAAGVGVARARSMRDGGYAAGLTEGASPYAAFAAAPGGGKKGSIGHGNAPQYPPGMIRGAGSPEFDLHRRPSQYAQQQQSQSQADHAVLTRNKSHQTTTSSSTPSYHSDPNSNGGYSGYPNSYNTYATSSPSGVAPGPAPAASGKHLQPIPSSRSEENLEEAYGGYMEDDAPHHTTHPPAGRHGAEYVDDSEDEVEEPRRILKVANE